MNLRRPIHTNRRLWWAFSIVSFILLGFADPALDRKENFSFWACFSYTVSDLREATTDELFFVTVYAFSLSFIAAGVGWLGETIVLAVLTLIRPEKTNFISN